MHSICADVDIKENYTIIKIDWLYRFLMYVASCLMQTESQIHTLFTTDRIDIIDIRIL